MANPQQTFKAPRGLAAVVRWASMALGTGLLISALVLPWHVLPVMHGTGEGEVVGQDVAVGWWRAGLLLVCLVGLLAKLSSSPRRRLLCGCLLCGLGAVLLFPWWLARVHPERMADAQWLATQHQQLTWLGGDVFTTQETILSHGAAEILLVDPAPASGTVEIPKSIPSLLTLGQLKNWIRWAGYQPGFTLFVGNGWLAAAFALMLFLILSWLRGGWLDLALVRFTFAAGLLVALFGSFLVAFPVVYTAQAVSRAHRELQGLGYVAARDWLARSSRGLSLIELDTAYLLQRGLIDHRLRMDTPWSRYFWAAGREELKYYAQAETVYRELLENPAVNRSLRREGGRGLMRAAVHDWNSGLGLTAWPKVDAVQAFNPLNLRALLLEHRLALSEGDEMRAAKASRVFGQVYDHIRSRSARSARALMEGPVALPERRGER